MRGETRREFLKQAGLAATLLSSGDVSFCQQTESWNLLEARKKATHRLRRMITNNDGNDVFAVKEDEPQVPESFLKKRTAPLLGSQVDSIFYCTGVFNLYTHQSKESELHAGNEISAKYIQSLAQQGTDPLKEMAVFGRKNGLEVFWSMRMNDTHDSSKSRTNLFCQWKKDHLDYLVAEPYTKPPFGAGRWSSVNYDVPEVRNKVYRILADVCSRYDIDGVELDFFRHPVLFKAQMTGDPITQEHCDKMTELMRRIRKMTESAGDKRKRPMLIAVRIPDSAGYCKALGIDLIQWLKEDLIDVVTGAGYFKLEPWENLAALGRQYDKAVYACFVARRIQGGEPEGPTSIQRWRGEAYNAWKAGVDGIYTFNRFNPNDPIFRELGDVKTLEKQKRIDRTAYVNETLWSRPEVWLKNGKDYIKEP